MQAKAGVLLLILPSNPRFAAFERLSVDTAAGMAAGHAIPWARNGDEVCEVKREGKAGRGRGEWGFYVENAEHSIATLVGTGPWSFFNHASRS